MQLDSFDWKRLEENGECTYKLGKDLYDDYKTRFGEYARSTTAFSARLKDVGLVKGQKRIRQNANADVVWVGFKRKGAELPLKPPSSEEDGESERRDKRPRLESRGCAP